MLYTPQRVDGHHRSIPLPEGSRGHGRSKANRSCSEPPHHPNSPLGIAGIGRAKHDHDDAPEELVQGLIGIADAVPSIAHVAPTSGHAARRVLARLCAFVIAGRPVIGRSVNLGRLNSEALPVGEVRIGMLLRVPRSASGSDSEAMPSVIFRKTSTISLA